MATVLEELGVLHLTRPGRYASDAEVGAWQERRAVMLDHVAAEGGLGLDIDRASALALAAHERAARLLGQYHLPVSSRAGGDSAKNPCRSGSANPHLMNGED